MSVIRRSYKNLDIETFQPLYKALVRSNLEYASSAWSPYTSKQIELIERVQRRATKLVPELKELTYTEKLKKKLKLPTLKFRHIRGDMIECYKILNNIYDKGTKKFITLREEISLRNRNRQNSKHIFQNHANRNRRKNFFTNRIVNTWNSLPEQIVTAPSVNSFKNRLDKHWRNQEAVYDHNAPLRGSGIAAHFNDRAIEDSNLSCGPVQM